MTRKMKWGHSRVLVLCLFIVALILGVGGCSPIREGWITNKEFVPAHQEEEMVQISEIDGIPIYGTETVDVPDSWYLTFRRKKENGEWASRTIKVSKETYDAYETDEWFELE